MAQPPSSAERELAALRAQTERYRESEERFRSAFEYAAIGMALVAPDGRFTRVNHALCEMLGYAEAELLARDFQSITHPDDLDKDYEVLHALLAGSVRHASWEKRYFHKNGETIWIELTVSVVRGPQGRIVDIIAQIQDITERKRMEQTLRESELRFRSVFNQTLQLMALTTPDGTVIALNEPALAMSAPTAQNGLGKKLWESPVWARSPEAQARLREGVAWAAKGRVARFELSRQAESGELESFDGSIKPVLGEAGAVVSLLAEGRDITALKTALTALARQSAELDKARELNELKSNFVNAVSHELRTPLTLIKGYAEFLADGIAGPLGKEQARFVHELELGASRLEYLVSDLLDYARMEAGTFSIRPEESDLAAKLHEILESFRPLIQDARLRTELSLDGPSLPVSMDAQRIGQVITNLLSNALKFSPAGGVIQVRAFREAGVVRVEVQDAGPGIAPEDLPKLFQRFTQLEAGRRHGKGTGLGLSISRAIVEAHHGHIGVESAPGAGSTFWFSLPLP